MFRKRKVVGLCGMSGTMGVKQKVQDKSEEVTSLSL